MQAAMTTYTYAALLSNKINKQYVLQF